MRSDGLERSVTLLLPRMASKRLRYALCLSIERRGENCVIEAHLRKLRVRDRIGSDEEAALRDCVSEVRRIGADVTVVQHGQPVNESLLLIDGWMARTMVMSDGQQQISELQFCGDFVDLHGFTLKRLDHNVTTLTPCRVAVVPHDNLRRLLERFPHLTRMYWLMTNIDAAIHREWTVSLGRRPALSRMAHLFCEIYERLRIVGQTSEDGYDFPLTQQELAECLGLTSVHINRTLQELRRRELVEVRRRRVTIPDLVALQAVGEFDSDYLYLERCPR